MSSTSYFTLASKGKWRTLKSILDSSTPPSVIGTLPSVSSFHKPLRFLRNIPYYLWPSFLRAKLVLLPESTFMPAFPNPHLRTTGFIADRRLFVDYIRQVGFPVSKSDCHEFESGYHSFVRFALKSGNSVSLFLPESFDVWDRASTNSCFSSFSTPDSFLVSDHRLDCFFSSSPHNRILISALNGAIS